MGYGIKILIRGERACFTRPEMHTERVSYDVLTPSAARGIIEAVYWKPAIVWRIDAIQVNKPIRFETMRRNEVGSKASHTAALLVMRGKHKPLGILAPSDRQQRNTLYLTDVEYVVDAHFELTDKAGPDDTESKHYNIALRRLRNGQCFSQPYLGCREFPAEVTLVEEGEASPSSQAHRLKSYYCGEGERDLGFMLYDIAHHDNGAHEPLFFRAIMRNGCIDVASARNQVIA